MAWHKAPNEPTTMHWLGATRVTFGECEACRFRGIKPADAIATAMWVQIPGGLIVLPVCRTCLHAVLDARKARRLVLNPEAASAVARSRARAKVRVEGEAS